MTDEEKDILNKHVRRWATEYYQLFLEDEDEDVVRGALNAYDAVAMLACENGQRLWNRFILLFLAIPWHRGGRYKERSDIDYGNEVLSLPSEI